MKELCGCCEGLEKITPLDTYNRPGLDALSYRVGTHATFLETMMARLTTLSLEVAEETETVNRIYPLHHLTTRSFDDHSLALLDSWATVADVLTFYQERIANEGYLRTARERRSILELARLVGYKLRPGVSASVFLAFDLEKGYDLQIEPGLRAQSLPGPGELPQSFETGEKLEARAAWNRLGVRMTRPQYIDSVNINPEYIFSWDTLSEDDKDRLTEFLTKKFGFNWITPDNMIKKNAKTIEISGGAKSFSLVLIDENVSLMLGGNIIDGLIAKTENNVTKIYDGSRAISKVYLEGISTNLKPNDPILFIFDEETSTHPPVLRKVEAIEAQSTEDRTIVTLQPPKATNDTKQEGGIGGQMMMAAGTVDPASLLIKGLLTPPSLPPASPRKLERKLIDVFAEKADIGTQTLINLAPVLKERYYPAWSGIKVASPPSQMKSVEALRVKARPFGHNAPSKPIYDDKGVPVGNEEWPLAGMTIGIKLIYPIFLRTGAPLAPASPDPDEPVRVSAMAATTPSPYIQLSLEYRNEIFSAVVDTISQSVSSIPLGDITVTIEKMDNPYIFAFSDKWLRKIAVLVKDSHAEITFNDNLEPDITLGIGQKQRFYKDDQRIMASYEYLTEAGLVVSVSDGLLLEPDVAEQKILFLDAPYDKILPESWIAIERPGSETKILKVTSTQTVSRADYGITGTVTQLNLDGSWLESDDKDHSALREITIYAQGEALPLAEEVIDPEKLVNRIVDGKSIEERVNDICKHQIELDGLYDSLKSGRWLIVSGERTDVAGARGVKASELVMLSKVTQDVSMIDEERLPLNSDEKPLPGDRVHTFLTLALEGLKYCYKRDTVNIYANVAKATHGETRSEVLGSGDGSRVLQEFQLRQSPLTYLAAPTPAGAESTLQARVNDVLWHEADSLAGLEPTDRKYITSTDDQSKTSVVFGNGLQGSRLPSGSENVRAVYRTGIGKPGNVKAEQISQLAARPLGLKGVINPLPAAGGADRESRDQARRNAPLAVLSLDRLVSVQDYADFARTFAGIGKARATEITNGRRKMVFLTIAGADDIPIDEHCDLYQNLVSALHKYGDPHQPIRVELRELLMLVVSANVRILPDYLWDKVEPRIRAAMLDAFSFDRRELGQDVLLSEVISVIQGVEGVDYADVDVLVSVPEKEFESKIEIFCWDEVPGKHEERLKEFLIRRLGFEWVRVAEIEKKNYVVTIKVSDGSKSLSLKLNKENNEVTLEIGNARTIRFVAKKEYSKLNIYPIKGLSETRRNLTPDDILNWVQDRNDECISEFRGPCPRIPVNLASLDKDGVLRPDQIAYLTPDVPDTLILKRSSHEPIQGPSLQSASLRLSTARC